MATAITVHRCRVSLHNVLKSCVVFCLLQLISLDHFLFSLNTTKQTAQPLPTQPLALF